MRGRYGCYVNELSATYFGGRRDWGCAIGQTWLRLSEEILDATCSLGGRSIAEYFSNPPVCTHEKLQPAYFGNLRPSSGQRHVSDMGDHLMLRGYLMSIYSK